MFQNPLASDGPPCQRVAEAATRFDLSSSCRTAAVGRNVAGGGAASRQQSVTCFHLSDGADASSPLLPESQVTNER